MSEPGAAKPRRGCLFYGCLSATACLLVILIVFLLGLYQFKKVLNFYTDTRPAVLPTVQMPQAEIEQVRQQLASFEEAVRSARPTPPLALSAEQINALIQTDTNLARLKGKLYVGIEGDRLKGQVSLPLGDLGLSLLRGRYLNGSGIFAVGLRNGELVVTPESAEVKGKPLPSVYLEKLRAQNLAVNLNNDPAFSGPLSHLQEIRVGDGKLVLVPKVAP